MEDLRIITSQYNNCHNYHLMYTKYISADEDLSNLYINIKDQFSSSLLEIYLGYTYLNYKI